MNKIKLLDFYLVRRNKIMFSENIRFSVQKEQGLQQGCSTIYIHILNMYINEESMLTYTACYAAAPL